MTDHSSGASSNGAVGGIAKFNGVKVFTATKSRERAALGDRVSDWIRQNRTVTVIDSVVTQSSDSEYHCLSISVFYRDTRLAS